VEGELDSLLEHELEYQGIVYDDIDVDWLSTYKAVAENVVTGTDALIRDGEFEHTLPDAPCHLTDAVKTFRFIRVEHPREYNFHNDLIIVEAEVCKENLQALLRYCQQEHKDFSTYVEELTKERSGFSPFGHYTQGWEEWIEDCTQCVKLRHCLAYLMENCLASKSQCLSEAIESYVKLCDEIQYTKGENNE
jgi:hypothetical protein